MTAAWLPTRSLSGRPGCIGKGAVGKHPIKESRTYPRFSQRSGLFSTSRGGRDGNVLVSKTKACPWGSRGSNPFHGVSFAGLLTPNPDDILKPSNDTPWDSGLADAFVYPAPSRRCCKWKTGLSQKQFSAGSSPARRICTCPHESTPPKR